MTLSSFQVNITIILTAHNEGRLAHRSVQSARRCVAYAQSQGIVAELIAVLDKPSQDTIRYFSEHEKLFESVLRTDFGDPAPARNLGVERARGRFVTFLDADDLICENWLIDAYNIAIDFENPVILHPQYILRFGDTHQLIPQISSEDKSFSPLNLIKYHQWMMFSFIEKNLFFDDNLYLASDLEHGFAHEDWHWHCETLSKNIPHHIVPETVAFVRMREESYSKKGVRTFGVARPSRLFDDELLLQTTSSDTLPPTTPYIRSVETIKIFFQPRNLLFFIGRGGLRLLKKATLKRINADPVMQRFAVEILAATRQLVSTKLRTPIPEWLLKEWRNLHALEPELYPSHYNLSVLQHSNGPQVGVTRLYPELSREVGPSPSHVFLLPWLKAGGADLEVLKLIEGITDLNPQANVVCITTENTDSSWLKRLPASVRVIELGKRLAAYPRDDHIIMLTRLLLQKKPQVIHNSNSITGYEIYIRHGRALATQSSLYASLYCEDIIDGQTVGVAFSELQRCFDVLSGVICDNARFVRLLCKIYAFEAAKFHIIAFPAPERTPCRRTREDGDEQGLEVLWASRFDAQKRPDILLDIIRQSSHLPFQFHIYGEPLLDSAQHSILRQMKKLPNVTLYGSYENFDVIPTENFDVFLYTSQIDGFPNILLEVIASGLPVIAPDVGGISELIDNTSGYLVSRCEAVDEYITFLKDIMEKPEAAAVRVEEAILKIRNKHSQQSFLQNIGGIKGYAC